MTIDDKYRIEDVGEGTISQERRSRINSHGELELGGEADWNRKIKLE